MIAICREEDGGKWRSRSTPRPRQGLKAYNRALFKSYMVRGSVHTTLQDSRIYILSQRLHCYTQSSRGNFIPKGPKAHWDVCFHSPLCRRRSKEQQ